MNNMSNWLFGSIVCGLLLSFRNSELMWMYKITPGTPGVISCLSELQYSTAGYVAVGDCGSFYAFSIEECFAMVGSVIPKERSD